MNHVLQHVHRELKKHSSDYLLFATACIFFLIALNIFRGERLIEFIILLAFTISFFLTFFQMNQN